MIIHIPVSLDTRCTVAYEIDYHDLHPRPQNIRRADPPPARQEDRTDRRPPSVMQAKPESITTNPLPGCAGLEKPLHQLDDARLPDGQQGDCHSPNRTGHVNHASK